MPRDLDRRLIQFEALLPPEISERDESSFLNALSASQMRLVDALLERAETAGAAAREIGDLVPLCRDDGERDLFNGLMATAQRLAT